jgi:hypothetical protein
VIPFALTLRSDYPVKPSFAMYRLVSQTRVTTRDRQAIEWKVKEMERRLLGEATPVAREEPDVAAAAEDAEDEAELA